METTDPSADRPAQAPTYADVYERLYDRRSYTGVYRKRFEIDIHDLTDSIVHDLSDTIRPNLNRDVEGKSRRQLSPRLSMTSASPAPSPEPPTSSNMQKQSPERAPCPSPIRLEGDPNDPHTLLRAVFHYYCRFGRTGARGANETTMDNANFSKLCRESPDLLDATFISTDVDIIFIKAKKKGERRISYTQFLDALGMIAVQKYPDLALETSVPRLLELHLAKLPCVLEFTDGRMMNAIWEPRQERTNSGSSVPPSPRTPSRRASSPQRSPPAASMPPPAPVHSPPGRRASTSSIPSQVVLPDDTIVSSVHGKPASSPATPHTTSPHATASAHGDADAADDEDEEGGPCFAS